MGNDEKLFKILEALQASQDRMQERQDKMQASLERMQTSQDKMQATQDKMQATQDKMQVTQDKMLADISAIKSRQNEHGKVLFELKTDVRSIKDQLDDMDSRNANNHILIKTQLDEVSKNQKYLTGI